MEDVKQNLRLLKDAEASDSKETIPPSRSHPESETRQQIKEVKRKRLINKLNFINFQDESIIVVLKHIKYGHTDVIEAKPQPCHDENLKVHWTATKELGLLQSYRIENLLVPDGANLLQVTPELVRMDEKEACFRLPESCDLVSSRKVNRHACKNIHANLVQNSTIFSGTLLDFNATSFRVRVSATPPQSFQWLNPESTVTIIFSNDEETIYTGDCRIFSQTCGQRSRECVLEPIKNEIQRFKHKEFRSVRLKVTPSPNVVFKHPFSNKLVSLKALNVSGAGFAVEEEPRNAVLLPGMMIPEMELHFTSSLRLKCKAQVIYRQSFESGKKKSRIKCGLALLDMEPKDHIQLVSLLHQTENEHSYVCNKVDLDDLWDFFFETGFIYPNKYEFIRKNKQQIKETYEKLYTRNPTIARHFIYQENSRILGHMSMLRFYENTWLIQHHAARNSDYNRAGLVVLSQMGRFGNDSHRLYSIHMNYVICFYRPNNKFPKRVFGGACRSIKNLKGCSEDLFGYTHFHRDPKQSVEFEGPGRWELSVVQEGELFELENYYEHASGGLMLNALHLEPSDTGQGGLVKEYEKLGFKRKREIYSLKLNDSLKAIFALDLSDIGLNLSDLTNRIMVFVLDTENLTKEVFYKALSQLMQKADQDELPVMIYPDGFAEEVSIPIDKKYTLWVINPLFQDEYFRYLNRLMRFFKFST